MHAKAINKQNKQTKHKINKQNKQAKHKINKQTKVGPAPDKSHVNTPAMIDGIRPSLDFLVQPVFNMKDKNKSWVLNIRHGE